MRVIKIIDALHLDEQGVKSKTKNGRLQTVHLRQGDLDGACAVYATVMVLIMIKALKYSEIGNLADYGDGRFALKKLKKELFELKGMHRDGNYFFHEEFDSIASMLRRSYSKYVEVEHIEKDVISVIADQIANNQPVLMSYSAKGAAHALVAIGIETDKNDDVRKIFCLDPAYDAPKFTYWNSVIDLETFEGRYNYRNFTESGQCAFIKLEDVLIISKR
ncbi:MAG: hypothetical protein EOO51_08415 [Flavobacterium sp.]|nr:MAG: hypothetical protein EOO51_08415 [Flavobacterium sp.]